MTDVQPPIHRVSWASQPDLLIDCTQEWDTPAWGAEVRVSPDVFRTEKGLLYTFEPGKVTCPKCLGKYV